MFRHSAICRMATEQHRRACARYREAWPQYCTGCGGWGAFVRHYPGTREEPPADDIIDCPDCMEQGLCPRCHAALPLSELAPIDRAHAQATIGGLDVCPACGWRYGVEGLVDGPECYCDGNDPDIAIIRPGAEDPESGA